MIITTLNNGFTIQLLIKWLYLNDKHPFLIHCQDIRTIIEIRVFMRIIVPLTVEMIVPTCKRKLQYVFYHSHL